MADFYFRMATFILQLTARNVMRYLGIYLILIKIAVYEVIFTA